MVCRGGLGGRRVGGWGGGRICCVWMVQMVDVDGDGVAVDVLTLVPSSVHFHRWFRLTHFVLMIFFVYDLCLSLYQIQYLVCSRCFFHVPLYETTESKISHHWQNMVITN